MMLAGCSTYICNKGGEDQADSQAEDGDVELLHGRLGDCEPDYEDEQRRCPGVDKEPCWVTVNR